MTLLCILDKFQKQSFSRQSFRNGHWPQRVIFLISGASMYTGNMCADHCLLVCKVSWKADAKEEKLLCSPTQTMNLKSSCIPTLLFWMWRKWGLKQWSNQPAITQIPWVIAEEQPRPWLPVPYSIHNSTLPSQAFQVLKLTTPYIYIEDYQWSKFHLELVNCEISRNWGRNGADWLYYRLGRAKVMAKAWISFSHLPHPHPTCSDSRVETLN